MADFSAITNVLPSGLGGGGNLKGYFLLFFLLLGFCLGVYALYSVLRYRKIKVVIFSERRGGRNDGDPAQDLRPYMQVDRAIIKKGQDCHYLWLRKNKAYVQYPPPYAIVPSKGCVTIFLEKLGADTYYPVNVKIDTSHNMNIKIDEGKKLFSAMVWRKMRDTFGETSVIPKEYIPLIGIMILAVFIIVMFSMLLKKFDVIAGAASALDSAATTLASASARCG